MTKINYNFSEASKPSGEQGEWMVDCPVCLNANHLSISRKVSRDGDLRYFLYCHAGGCQALGGGYLAAVAEAVSAPNGSAIKEDPLRWLGLDAGSNGSVDPRRLRGDAPFVSEGKVGDWHRKLIASPDVLNYIQSERGLTVATIDEHAIGYDGRAITIPTWLDPALGLVSNIKRRYWPEPRVVKGEPVWKTGMAGARSALYPDPPPGNAWIICEGELDALLARQHGIPSVTSTAGTSWSPDWDHFIRGKRIAVVYDAGEHSLKIAKRRATQLMAAGVEAWPVDLGLAGLQDGEDLTDWFMKYRRTADELLRLIREARRS